MTYAQKQKYRYILALGHLCSDLNQGTLSAVLPFLIAAHHYDYTTAAGLVMVSNIVGSMIQPLFGHLADKKNKPAFMTLGVLLAGGGMALTGLIANFWGLCVAVMISGVGIAMFHPQAARMVNQCSSSGSKGTALGIFSFGGNLGFTLGPVITTAGIAVFGLKGTLIFLIPSVLFGVIASVAFKDMDGTTVAEVAPKAAFNHLKDRWGAFTNLSLLVVCRSIANSGINTFIVLYFVDVMGKTENFSNTLLSGYFAVTAISALAGGRLADSLGYRRTVRLSSLILLPAVLLFALTHSPALSVALLLPIGIGISLCYSPLVLLGQQYLPNHMGLASGVTLGLAVSIGGVVSPLLGKIGDLYGLTASFYVIGIVAAMALAFSLFLADPAQEKANTIKETI